MIAYTLNEEGHLIEIDSLDEMTDEEFFEEWEEIERLGILDELEEMGD